MVTVAQNLDLKDMRLTIQQFVDKLPKKATVFFFFFGHGAQYNGQNYLIPIGGINAIKAPGDLDREAISVSDTLEEFNRSGAAVTVALLDACRNSPFAPGTDIKPGLARNAPRTLSTAAQVAKEFAKSPGGVLISYSTAPNAVALDGNGRNSPYTQSLKTEIAKANVNLENVLKATRSAVTNETKGEQTLWYESSIDGEVFAGGRNRMEFESLLNAFLPDTGNRYDSTAMSWDIKNLEPVEWKGDGIELSMSDDYKIDHFEGSFRRIVQVVIPVLHFMGKTREPARWTITMIGPHAAQSRSIFSMN